MHVKCSANDVNRFGLRDLFDDYTGRTLWRLLMQEEGNGIQSREAPIDALDATPRLDKYMGGLKGRGCCWVQLLDPLLAVFPCRGATLCKCSISNW